MKWKGFMRKWLGGCVRGFDLKSDRSHALRGNAKGSDGFSGLVRASLVGRLPPSQASQLPQGFVLDMSLEYDSNPVGAAVRRSDLPAMAASGSPQYLRHEKCLHLAKQHCSFTVH